MNVLKYGCIPDMDHPLASFAKMDSIIYAGQNYGIAVMILLSSDGYVLTVPPEPGQFGWLLGELNPQLSGGLSGQVMWI